MAAGNILQILHLFLTQGYGNHCTVHTVRSDSCHILHMVPQDKQPQLYRSDQDLHLLQLQQPFLHIHVPELLGILLFQVHKLVVYQIHRSHRLLLSFPFGFGFSTSSKRKSLIACNRIAFMLLPSFLSVLS